MLTLQQARDYLRIDGADNDEIISALLEAIPSYIEVSAGMTPADQYDEPMIDTVSRFIISLWYNAEQSEAEKLQRTIDGLLKAITIKARSIH
jgi:hypothetical protein